MVIDLGQILIPVPDLLFPAPFENQRLSTSIQMMNMYGERGSPCRIPLVGVQRPLGSPFTITEQEIDEIHSLIHLFQVG